MNRFTVLAALAFVFLPSAQAAKVPRLTLRVNGETFITVKSSTRVTLKVSVNSGWRHVQAHLYELAPGDKAYRSIGSCYVSSGQPCTKHPLTDEAGKWIYVAYVESNRPGEPHSNAVTVTVKESPTQPTELEVFAAGATRGFKLADGSTTCEGAGQKFGTGCFVDVKQDSDVPVTVSVDHPLPTGWTLELIYNGLQGDQVLCTTKAEQCEFTVHTPKLSQASGVTVKAYIALPSGWVASALGLSLTQ